jgi:hypothetical protein
VQKPVVEPLKSGTGSNLVDLGRYCSVAVASGSEETDFGADVAKVGAGVTVKVCGVAVARAAGEELGTYPVHRLVVNVGTVVGPPSRRPVRPVTARPVTARHAVC